jgi:hypothetical protein
LSAPPAEKETTAEHKPAVVDVLILAGHLIVGISVSLTVTVNEQVLLLPLASLTEQVTVVTPFGKVEPDAGAQVTAPTLGQLSVADGVE